MEYYSAMQKKKRFSHICYNMDKPRKHYVKWNKSDAKGQILHDSTYEVPVTGKVIETESRIEVTRGWGEEEWEIVVWWLQSSCLRWWKSFINT